MADLNGLRVALLERRRSDLADRVRRRGGVPYCVPVLREVCPECDAEVADFLRQLVKGTFSTAVFLDGDGVETLFCEAERLDCAPALANALRRLVVVCR